MLTSFSNLTSVGRHLIESGVENLVLNIGPEMIVCFGTREHIISPWSPFFMDAVPVMRIECDLIIVLREDDCRRDHEVTDIVNRQATETLAFTAVVHRLDAVRQALRENSRFFITACNMGVLLYGNARLLEGHISVLPEWEDVDLLHAQWSRWFGLSTHFFKSAVEQISHGWYTLAVFMLRQAVEHTCIAVVRVWMGYRPSTHNLVRLLQLMANFSSEVNKIFPRFTNEECRLFRVLQKAYTDARYNEVYNVSLEDITTLVNRIMALQELAELFYYRKVNALY